MRDIVHSYVRKFREERRERCKFLGVLLCLALAVAGGIMWQFKTTGIAYTNEAQCGIEEHTHSDDCYAWVLTEDTGAEETAAEAETSDVLSVVVEEAATVESEEAETQDAAAETANATSQAAESDESADAGSAETAVESENAAEESTDSTDAEISEETLPTQVLLTEATETEDWYLSHGYEKVLICGKEEHIHTIECLSDETADLETAEVWEATLPSLTGVWADDVVAIAESQIGYAESTLNFTLAEDGATRKGYTRYGAWYGNAYGDWDAMFAAFCLHYAGVSESDFPVNSGAYAWSVSLKEAGLYQAADSCTPSAGDMAFLDKDQDGTVDTVAVITNVNDTTLTVVEGNSNDAVEENIYEISDGVVVGYGVLPEQNADSLTGLTKTYTAEAETEDGSVIVTVTAPYGALPDDAVLSVTLYEEDSDEYAAAAETIGYEPETAEVAATEDGIALASEDDTETETVATSGLAVLDICFMVGDEEVEPSEAVTVSIDASAIIPEEANASTIEVQHLIENEDGEVEAVLVADATEETAGTVTVDAEEATAVAEFEVGSFSTFTIEWKRDNNDRNATSIEVYVYDEDGDEIEGVSDNTASYSLTGNTTVTIETLQNNIVVPDSYTFSYAAVDYTTQNGSGTVGTSSTDSVTSIQRSGDMNASYSIYKNDSSTASVSNARSITAIYLYYTTSDPVVKVSATNSTGGTYVSTLNATTKNFSEDAELTWSWDFTASDKSGNAYTVAANDDGTYTVTNTGGAVIATISIGEDETSCVVTWADASAYGDTVVATATATNSNNNTETASKSATVTCSKPDSSFDNYLETSFSHIDVKVALAESSSSSVDYTLYQVTSITVYSDYGTSDQKEVGSASSTQTNTQVNNEWSYFKTSFSGSDTIVITYVVSYKEDGETKTETYTAILDADSTYADGTYYPYDGANAYKLYNYIYGTSYSSNTGLYNAGITEVDISGMSIYLVAAILCDRSSVSNQQLTSTDGLDFALDVGTLMQYTANFDLKIEKTYLNASMSNDKMFSFTLSEASVNDVTNYWTVGEEISIEYTGTAEADESTGNSSYTVEFDGIIYESGTSEATYTYYYVLKENAGTDVNVAYDGTIYGVKVVVTVTETTAGSGNTKIYTATVAKTYYTLELVDGTSDQYQATEIDSISETSSGESVFPFVNVYSEPISADLKIKKISDDETTTLNGAVFTLSGGDLLSTVQLTTENGGIAFIEGLSEGAYTLTEVTAPDGYNLLTEPINFTLSEVEGEVSVSLDSEDASYEIDADGNITITVINTAGAVLPSTGGPGTYLYTLAGLLLIMSAVCLMYKNLRRKGDLPY